MRAVSRIAMLAAVLFVALGAGAVSRAAAADFVVDSRGDAPDANPYDYSCDTSGGACTLRAAIEQAEEFEGSPVTIGFDSSFDGGPEDRIFLSSPLTIGFVNDRFGALFLIDGSGCASGFRPVPCVWVGYPSQGAQDAIQVLRSGGVLIRGVAVGNAAVGIRSLAAGITVEGSWFGLGPGGVPTPNVIGIAAGPQQARVVGNHFAGGVAGMTMASPQNYTSYDSTLAYNVVGLDPLTGQRVAAPSAIGVQFVSSTSFNSLANIEGNVVSMSTGIGLDLTGGTAGGNYVGISPSGADIGGGTIGVQMRGTNLTGNTIGNATGEGIRAIGFGQISGNYVGTDASGADHGNGGPGIVSENDALVPFDVGAPYIGMLPSGVAGNEERGTANIISNSGGAAIAVLSAKTDDVFFGANRGRNNRGLFIDLGGDGPGNKIGASAGQSAPRIVSAGRTSATGYGEGSVLVFLSDASSPGDLGDFLGVARADRRGGNKWTVAYPPQGDGSEVTAFQVIYQLGRHTSETVSRAVDVIAPSTKVRRARGSSPPAFKLSSNEREVTFRCRVDGGAEKTCPRRAVLRGLKPGRHRLTAVAVDEAGNRDATPAKARFRVRRR